MKKKASKR